MVFTRALFMGPPWAGVEPKPGCHPFFLERDANTISSDWHLLFWNFWKMFSFELLSLLVIKSNIKSFFKSAQLTKNFVPFYCWHNPRKNGITSSPIVPQVPSGSILQDFALHHLFFVVFSFFALSLIYIQTSKSVIYRQSPIFSSITKTSF